MRRSNQGSRPGKIDIHDVAAHAHVSIATVSRTMNHIPTVDPALAARVWKAIEELNYTPNRQARALVSGKSRLLGLIVSEITNPFFPELIQEFEKIAVERGYEVLIGSTNYDPRTMESCVRRMLERKVEGVAVMTFGMEQRMLDRFAVLEVPLVYVDRAPKLPGNAVLTIDYRAGILEGVRHLAGLGHTRLAFIAGPQTLYSAKARRKAFLDSLRAVDIGANPAWIVEADHTLEGGRDAMARLLEHTELPTAIMCSNDMTAIGVQHALFAANLRVPEDMSIIGFDDIHLAEYTIPPLTTVRMSCQELAQRAVKAMLSYLQQDTGQGGKEARISTKLIVRQTTGAPRSNGSPKPPRSPATAASRQDGFQTDSPDSQAGTRETTRSKGSPAPKRSSDTG